MKKTTGRIRKIYEKNLSENPETVYRAMRNRKTPPPLLRTLLVIATAAAILLIFGGIAVPVMEEKLGETAEKLIVKHGRIFIPVIYSPLDEWGKETADSFAGRLSGTENLTVAVVTDSEFTDPGREKYPGELNSVSGEKTDEGGYCLAVSIGHTLISDGTFLDDCFRLGFDGYSIFHRSADGKLPDTVFISAVASEPANEAAGKFADYFLSANSFTRLFGRLFLNRAGRDIPEKPVMSSFSGSFSGVLTVSKPSASADSLDSFRRMLDASAPTAVIFNGGLDCGKSDAEGISGSWAGIAALLRERGIIAFCMFSHADSETKLPQSELKKIISAQLGEGVFLADDSGWILFSSDGEKPDAAVLLCGGTGADLPFYSLICRDAGEKIPAFAVFPGVTEEIFASPVGVTADANYVFGIYEKPDKYLSSDYNELFLSVLEAGFPAVFYAGNNNAGVFDAELGGAAGRIGFCGSVDRDSYGLGGRLALNNSLRGGILLTADGSSFIPAFLRAADCAGEGDGG